MGVFFIFLSAYLALFLIIDILQRKVITFASWSRRLTHILSGGISYFLPVYLPKEQIIVLALVFTVALGVSKCIKILTLHETKRQTIGEILYPLSFVFVALICLPQKPRVFQLAALVLALSDGLAGLIGENWPVKKITLWGHTKSIGGSLVFFISAFILFILFTVDPGGRLMLIIGISVVLTVFEMLLFYGLDNVVIPVAAAFAAVYLL